MRALWISLLLLAPACAGPSIDLIETGAVRLDVRLPDEPEVAVHAVAENGAITLFDTVHRPSERRTVPRGRIAAALLGADGAALARGEVPLRIAQRGRFGDVEGTFRIALPAAAPPDAVLVLEWRPAGGE
jgi:hypothetical protein